uniref:Actin n=1 Tax=Panagrolaimus sp. ES5 TaxID=591445 RepID=A0AC34FZS7_9BILA
FLQSNMDDVITNQPVVIDNGSGMIKAGFAGDPSPKCKFYNYSGRPKHTRCMAGALEGDVFIGPKCADMRGLMSLKYPMEHGIVTDWNEMERIWSYIYSGDELKANANEHPVLLTEAPLNPAKNRLKAAEIFFETFNVPAFHCQMQAVLSLYSCGRITGVVVDSGDGVTHVVPVFEGFAIDHGPKHTRCMAGALEGDVFIGPKCADMRGLMSLKYPMEHGIVTDWNEMERIWSYIYSGDELKANANEHPVLLTEAPLNPAKNRLKAAEIFFETFNVPAFHCQMQAVLSLYSCGRITGVVVDSGDGVTHVVPVFEGFAIDHGIQRIDVAGRDVTRYLRTLLRKEGYNFHKTPEFEIVREMKEKCCFLSTQSIKDSNECDKLKLYLQPDQPNTMYKLPDGQEIELGACRNRAPEVLFRPELIGAEYDGIPQCIANSIAACDIDLRKTLYSNIVLSGGSTLFSGFGDRLLGEMRKIAPKDSKVRIVAPQERLIGTWVGGSILASLDTFRKIWVTKKEFEDDPKVIFRKTF